jgi:hypothetical protein
MRAKTAFSLAFRDYDSTLPYWVSQDCEYIGANTTSQSVDKPLCRGRLH